MDFDARVLGLPAGIDGRGRLSPPVLRFDRWKDRACAARGYEADIQSQKRLQDFARRDQCSAVLSLRNLKFRNWTNPALQIRNPKYRNGLGVSVVATVYDRRFGCLAGDQTRQNAEPPR